MEYEFSRLIWLTNFFDWKTFLDFVATFLSALDSVLWMKRQCKFQSQLQSSWKVSTLCNFSRTWDWNSAKQGAEMWENGNSKWPAWLRFFTVWLYLFIEVNTKNQRCTQISIWILAPKYWVRSRQKSCNKIQERFSIKKLCQPD